MRASFTICANNYLASAKVLKESFSIYHPDIPFYIILVDKVDINFDYKKFGDDSIVFINDIVDLDFELLSIKFNISELCTTVKPFVYSHFFKSYNQIVYIDPDIKLYAPLNDCWDALKTYSFVLTPHLITPIDDDKIPTDFNTLRTGVFNLGFLGLSNFEYLNSFLEWWGSRLLKYGYCNLDAGMFYDQIWMNYIPVMYDNYYILKHPGYNVANWNWHERVISQINDTWMVNSSYPLVFFHFSSFKYSTPEVLCHYNSRYNTNNRPDLVPLFKNYYNDLSNAGAIISNNAVAHYHQNYLANLWKSKANERKLFSRIIHRIIRFLKTLL